MGKNGMSKKERQKSLLEKLEQEPFVTDEELSEAFVVSIQTIRLDRLELGIPELRERIRNVAENNYSKVKSIHGREIVGELIDLELGKMGMSILETDSSFAFEKTDVVKGQSYFCSSRILSYSSHRC